MFVNSTTAYVAGTTSTGSQTQQGTGEVRVIDVSKPDALAEPFDLAIPGTVQVLGIGIQGTTALVVGSTNGFLNPVSANDAGINGNLTLTVLDISTPASPTILGTTRITTSTFSLTDGFVSQYSVVGLGSGEFAVSQALTGGSPSLLLLNTNNPGNIGVASVAVPDLLSELTVVGGDLYATSSAGLTIYSVASFVGTPARLSVEVPTTAPVVAGSYSVAPDQIITGSTYNTLIWNRTFAYGETGTDTFYIPIHLHCRFGNRTSADYPGNNGNLHEQRHSGNRDITRHIGDLLAVADYFTDLGNCRSRAVSNLHRSEWL